jgi:transposase
MMARYKTVDRSSRLLPVVFDDQIQPGTFEFALDYLIDQLDLSELDAKFKNDKTGAPAYDPRVMLKIVLLSYSRGVISSRNMEDACRKNVLFMAMTGDSAPQFTTIARFVCSLRNEIEKIFVQVLMTCEAQGLIGKKMFAIDGVKLPSNASKHCSGTHAELERLAQRMERTVGGLLARHWEEDELADDQAVSRAKREKRIVALDHECDRVREFLRTREPRRNAKGEELKSNVTDEQSAKMLTSKGAIQGYTGVAAVDECHQVIVGARAFGSAHEQAMLMPMIASTESVKASQTIITADSGYHSESNLEALHGQKIPALIADGLMRMRDERFQDQAKYKARGDVVQDKHPKVRRGKFRAEDFARLEGTNKLICPAGNLLYGRGQVKTNGRVGESFKGAKRDCVPCELRAHCLRTPEKTEVRQVVLFEKGQLSNHVYTVKMREAIDSERGRQLYGRRMATVEPVFGNLRHNKQLTRFTLRSQAKVNTQWNLYCLVHNIEKLANHGYAVQSWR